MCVVVTTAKAQQPGNTKATAIDLGAFAGSFNIADTRNTNLYTNDYEFANKYGEPTNDVFYKFTLTRPLHIIISHCDSEVEDTFLAVLKEYSWGMEEYAWNDDGHFDNNYTPEEQSCPNISKAYLEFEVLEAGTYYIVSEGNSFNGNITTRIQGWVDGDNREHPIIVGAFNDDFWYSDTKNTAEFTNQFTDRSPNDVFYQFTINQKMNVVISHCGSGLSDTYMTLLNHSGEYIDDNDDDDNGECSSSLHSFLRITLDAGTYYVVSEGYSSSGNITTMITGNIIGDFNYPNVPSMYSTEVGAVGSAGGAFDVSAMGGATYSVPIEAPPGVGGMQPSVAITYNSQAGNGIAGWGCNLSGISVITRAPKDIYHDGAAKGLTHLADEAYLLDGQRLILVSGTAGENGAVYSPESDPFTTVTVYGTYNTTTANTWFDVRTSDGMKYQYGNSATSRQMYTTGGFPRINAWYLNHAEDPLGNYMDYTYTSASYFLYPASISYGKNSNASGQTLNNIIAFDYEYRYDATPFVMEGVKGFMDRRLKTITTRTGASIYRTYELTYNTTGDGSPVKFSRLTDITEKNGERETLKPIKLEWSYLPAFSQTYSTISIDEPASISTYQITNRQFLSADLNGDGLTGIIGIYTAKEAIGGGTSITTKGYVFRPSLDANGNIRFNRTDYFSLGADFKTENINLEKNYSFTDYDGNGINELLVPQLEITHNVKKVYFYFMGGSLSYQNNFDYTLQGSSDEMPVFSTADIDNDGRTDVIYMEKGKSSNFYPCEIASSLHGRVRFDFSLSSKPEKMFVSDYNGDGLNDILVFYSGGYTIFWNQGNGISTTTFSDNNKITGTNITNVKMIRVGDFNGDGLPDFIMNATNDSKWHFALNNGNGTFTKQQACTLNIYDQSTSDDDDKFDCLVYDFDFDGKSDVIINKSMYNGSTFSTTHAYWMRSTGSGLTEVKHSTSVRAGDGLSSRYVLGDFNGDGQVELINYGYDCYNSTNANVDPTWQIYKNPNFSADRGKVTSVTDSYGGKTTISYASLANSGIYTKGTDSSYPMVNYTLPIHAVKTVNSGGMTTNYLYGGLKAHLKGKGLLGMSSQTVNNTTLGTVTKTVVNSWDANFYIPIQTYIETQVDGNTATTTTQISITNKGAQKYFAYPSSKTEVDLDGNKYYTTYNYDTTYGYITEEKTRFDNNNDHMYKTIRYDDYIKAGGRYQPMLITQIQKHADDASSFTKKKNIEYTSSGLPSEIIDNYQTSKSLTTYNSYDVFGNIIDSEVSGSGANPFVNYTEYDETKRFVTKTYTLPDSEVKTYTYDTWGNVLTEKDETNSSNILTTTHTYDNWGKPKSTVLPDGRKVSYRSGWYSNANKRFFTLVQESGQPWVKTWYDNLGREVLVESVGPKSMAIKKTKAYNAKNQLQQESSQQGGLTITQTYTYDGRGRAATFNNGRGQTGSYSYGKRLETTTTNNRNYTKTYDAWGNIVSSSDPASIVRYTYHSSGQPKSVTTNGATFSMEYYDTGLQKELNDPNAGKTTYVYDALGRITEQTDARNKKTTNVYDDLGRIKTSTLNGVVTNYTYGTSGNEKLRLIKVQSGSGSAFEYTYDNFGRVLTEKRYGSLTTYGYNSLGQLITIMPFNISGLTQVNREYDAYGNLIKVRLNNNQDIWELTSETGRVTTTRLGGTMTSTRTLNTQGWLTNQKTMLGSTTVHNMGYTFEQSTGNLISRTGMIDQTETFGYDNLDRLETVKYNGTTVMSMGYSPNGNISSKTGVGQYTYLPSKPHALEWVANSGAVIQGGNQYATYTDFNKIASISEEIGLDVYKQDITYGPTQERYYSSLKKNGNTVRYISYYGDYERITYPFSATLYYIQGGDGLAAIFVRKSGDPDKIYYVHKDHLGSIVKLTDGNGTTVFKASYDVWGKQTVTNNTFAFHRGYTGHEHLNEFGLINMNGRMYDPNVGRFLSPDPFVQAPDFSQSFNRYSYCLNNPLIYTDPTGEFFWLIPNIGWSKSGGFSIGLTAVLGIPGLLSTQAGVGYSFKSNDLNTYAGVSAAFNTASISYSTQSGWNAGWSVGISPYMGFPISTNFTSMGINYNITHKEWSGNLSAWNVNKGGWSFEPSVSAMVFPEHATNLVRGQGFRSNDRVLQRFVANGQHQRALDYFGFRGTYNPTKNNPDYIQGGNVGDYSGNTNSNGDISYGNGAFRNYDELYATYIKELYHSNKVLAGGSFEKQAPIPGSNIDISLFPEERLGFINQYKYMGLFPKVKGVLGQIMYYQDGCLNLNSSQMFKPRFWHFIYKIPRKF